MSKIIVLVLWVIAGIFQLMNTILFNKYYKKDIKPGDYNVNNWIISWWLLYGCFILEITWDLLFSFEN